MEQIQGSVPRFRHWSWSFPCLLGTRIYRPETKTRSWPRRRTPLNSDHKTCCQVELTFPFVVKHGHHHGRRDSNILYISRCRRSSGVDSILRCAVVWAASSSDRRKDIWEDPVTRNRVKQTLHGRPALFSSSNLKIRYQNVNYSQARRRHDVSYF